MSYPVSPLSRNIVLFLALLPLCLLHGCGSDSDSPTGPDGPDEPTVALIAPADGATLVGTTELIARAENADRVEFFCDDASVGTRTDQPYLLQWNSATVADGSHHIRVTAVGAGGSASDERTIFVNNGGIDVVVAVAPANASLELGETQQFEATVTGTADTRVSWSIDQGPSAGTITAGGFYTAPASLPSPPVATVRATSLAAPGASATAEITLSGGGGGGNDPDMAEVASLAFDSSLEIGNLGDESISTVAEAVWGASELAGATTFTGTLTQNPMNPDAWTYSPSPSDRLRIVYAGGPATEVVIRTFDGYTDGDWEDFLRQHDLDFDFRIPGQVETRIQSETRVIGDRRWEWTRRLTGSVAAGDRTLTLNLDYTGREKAIVEATGAEFELARHLTGTVSASAFQMIVDQSTWSSIVHVNDLHIRDSQIWSSSSVTIDGTTYAFAQAHVAWAAGTAFNDPGYFNVVVSPDYWVAEGSFLRNGKPHGVVRFDGPVVSDSHGPDLILDLGGGEEVLLHTLIDLP